MLKVYPGYQFLMIDRIMFVLARDLHVLFLLLLPVYAQRVWLRLVPEEHR